MMHDANYFFNKNSFYTSNMHIHIFIYSFGYHAIDSKNVFILYIVYEHWVPWKCGYIMGEIIQRI